MLPLNAGTVRVGGLDPRTQREALTVVFVLLAVRRIRRFRITSIGE